MIVDCKLQSSNYWNRNNVTLAYFDDIRKYPVLSVDEEKKLLEIIKNGDTLKQNEAKHKLILSNQRFVASVARRFSNQNNLLDLINEANIGLIEAINNYDLKFNGRFITYAVFWMRKYINTYLIRKECAIQPINAQKVYQYANKGREKFFAKHNRYPTEEELIETIKQEYNVTIPNKEDVTQYSIQSIDSPVMASNEDDNEYEAVGEFAIKTSSNNIDDFIENDDKNGLIKFLLKHLDERDRKIIMLYFGIGCEEETPETIADIFGLTKERVRQIIKLSIEKMQHVNFPHPERWSLLDKK